MSEAVVGIEVRPEAPTHIAAVRALLHEAFSGLTVATLVDRLRAEGDIILALVAVAPQDTVVGHIAFSRAQVEQSGGARPAASLAPLAVASSHRRRGIGAALVRTGLDQLRARGEAIVFVLGDPAYYGRFGFVTEVAQTFASPYAGPHFMALKLATDAPRGGTLRYPAAFDELG